MSIMARIITAILILGKLSVESTEPQINLPAPGVKKTMADVALPVDELPANKSRENK